MITITRDDGVVTLINVFGCEPKKPAAFDRRMGSCDGRDFWQASGRHLSDPTSGKDGTRVVN